MSLLNIKIVKFSDRIVYEVIDYDNRLKNYIHFFSFDRNDKNTITQSSGLIDNSDYFIKFFNDDKSTRFGDAGFFLLLKRGISISEHFDHPDKCDKVYDLMTSRLKILMDYIKKDLNVRFKCVI